VRLVCKIISALFLFHLTPLFSTAQQIKLVDSYSRSWSGGIAGHHGENYLFVIEFSKVKADVKPDTIWIGSQPVPVILSDSLFSQSANTKRIKKKNSVQFEIQAGTFFDDYQYKHMLPGDTLKKAAVHPPYLYKGIALLSYIYNGNKKYFEIDKIMRRGQPVAYP
jgi:hypothetical protein